MVGLLMGIPLGRITKKSHKNHAGVADNPEKNLGNRRQTSKNHTEMEENKHQAT
jgi:hypothetical protein